MCVVLNVVLPRFMKVNIQCPECSQRFFVDEVYVNKMVECGSCDHRFKVTQSTIVPPPSAIGQQSKQDPQPSREKIYPGEKQEKLKQFKSSLKRQEAPASFTSTTYKKRKGDVTSILPASPAQVIAVWAGLFIFAIGFVIFITQGKEGRGLQDVTNQSRFIIAGIPAFVGFILIIYGAKKNRVLGVITALLFAAGLMYMPIVYPETITPIGQYSDKEIEVNGSDTATNDESGEKSGAESDVKNYLGEEYIDELYVKVPDKDHAGIILVGSTPEYRLALNNYIASISMNRLIPPRLIKDGIYVEGVKADLYLVREVSYSGEVLQKKLTRIGDVKQILKDGKLFIINVDGRNMPPRNAGDYDDPNTEKFYQACLRDLYHLNPERQYDAVLKLSAAPKRFLEADISAGLGKLLLSDDRQYLNRTLTAFNLWAKPKHEVDKYPLELASKLTEKSEEIPEELMVYLVGRELAGSVNILALSWKKSPTKWQTLMVENPTISQDAILSQLPDVTPEQAKSAAYILERVGDKESLPKLRSLLSKSKGEITVMLKAAIDAIENKP